MNLQVNVHERGSVSLVSAVLTNPHDRRARFRLENELDGVVWPPRRRGRPEAGWDEAGFEGVIDPGDRLALGYAVPAPLETPAAVIAWSEPAADRNPSPDVRSAARSFRDPRPPRSVLSPVQGGELE